MARATPATAVGPGKVNHGFLDNRSVPRDVHLAARALPRAGRGADLRVRHVRQVDLPDARPTSWPGSSRSSARCRGIPLRGRDPQPGIPRARLFLAARMRTTSAHVFNAWTRMPELREQIDMPGAFTADFTVVRGPAEEGPRLRAGRQGLRALRAGPGAEPRRSRGACGGSPSAPGRPASRPTSS